MKLRIVNIGIVVAVVSAFATNKTSAQEALSKRNFEAEVQAAIQSAKTAAGFEHLGTLVRTCLLPQSGGENLSDNVPAYVTNLASAPERDTWYAASAKVFDNLYFVGGKLHSSWALTTKEGIILIDTIYPYNSEELVVGGMRKRRSSMVVLSLTYADHTGVPRCADFGIRHESLWAGRLGLGEKHRTGTNQWRRSASSPP
jgi:metallo-beta-lactamase class B